MGWPELVVACQICVRVGVELVSMVPSPSQNRPCFLPCLTLITICASKCSSVVGLYVGPWTSLAISVYAKRRGWMLALVNDSAGVLGVQSMSEVALPMWAKAYFTTRAVVMRRRRLQERQQHC